MVHRLNDLAPDGLRIIVPWHELEPGMSVFIPCINVGACEREAKKIAVRLQIDVVCRRGTQDNILGLRIWRVA